MAKKRNRKHSIIDGLETDLKKTVEYMIDEGYIYEDIVEYLKTKNVAISVPTVCRYAKRYEDTTREMKFIHENFKAILEETDKYPDLDTTEATSRILSYRLLEYIQDLDYNMLKLEEPTKVINTINGLIKSMAIKTTANVKSKEAKQLAYEQFKEELFINLRKEQPELYDKLARYLNQKKEGD